jgi:predicted transcriptional regulator
MKDSSITIRIDSDTKLRLEQIAKDDERSVSSLITLILKRYLAEHPDKD